MRTISTLLALGLVATGVIGTAGSASAATAVVKDGADATASLTDVLRMKVRHGQHRVVVRTKHTNLKRRNAAGASIYLDTEPERSGPEFVVDLGLGRGTDYQLTKVRAWKRVGDPRVCAFTVELDPAADTVKVKLPRTCLRTPEEVRVSLKMRDEADGSHPVTDWVPGRRAWTSWLGAA